MPTSTAKASGVFSSYQRRVVAILALLQFTIVLDFMILSPLGALVMPALKIGPSQFGLVVSTYAFSAGVSGILTAGFADRFDRKKLLLCFYCGFLVGTLLCGLAFDYAFLLIGRMVTGLFAGVVGSISFAIVTDLFPLELRGRVMGIIQTAFAASTVLGIPIALLLSNHWSWNAPFFMIVAVSAGVIGLIGLHLRPVDEHLKHHPDRSPVHHLLHTVSTPRYLQGFATTGLLTVGGFMLMPFTSAFVVHNVALPIERLPLLYVVTGAFAAVTGPLIGRATDAFGGLKVFGFGCAMTILMVLIYTHLGPTPLWQLVAVSALLQTGIFSRIISSSTVLSAVPAPGDRGSYMSVSSSLQQVAGGLAAMISGLIVVESPDGRLLHFDVLGYVLVVTTLLSLTLMYFISRRVAAQRNASAAPAEIATALE